MQIGEKLGAYEVIAKLGEGGMGEVYRARDSKLKREVALKVLPADVANDRERMARFQREAEVLASLNHPHIAQIYGIEDNALVMELVEGEDLAERLKRGAIPIDEALPIAKQIAEALEAAHEQGIIHRDLKPANIKVRPDGTVKVLDFGLAKAMGAAEPEGSALQATITSPAMTMRGMILGTAAYMAPEQAKGKTVDKRADIWAFGVVLFEMLSGQRAFGGDEVSDVLVAVLSQDVDLAALPPGTPRSVVWLIQGCLDRDPKNRVRDIGDARLTLMRGNDSLATSAPPRPLPRWRRMRPWALAGAVTVVAAAAVGWPLLSRTPAKSLAPPEVRFTIDGAVSTGAISPDGTRVAFRQRVGREVLLVVRSLVTGDNKTLPGAAESGSTVLAGAHFWSPDGTSIAFFSGQKLKRIDVDSGAIQTLADAPTPRGGAWAPDGTILFAPAGNGPLYRVASTGGAAQVVTTLNASETSHRGPQFLPDGRRFVYWTGGPGAVRGMYLSSLDRPGSTRLLEADGPASLAGDRVLFVREGVLYAQRLDPGAGKMAGEPIAIASELSANPQALPTVSASQNGVIAYRQDVDDRQQVQWVDRSGTVIERIGETRSGMIGQHYLSPDGGTLAFNQARHGLADVWLLELARGTLTRLAADASNPIWSPDGTRIAFTSGLTGQLQMYWQKLDGTGAAEIVLSSPEGQNLSDWSPDGRHLLFPTQSATNARDLWSVLVDGPERKPTPFVQSLAEETNGRFSPDGQWVAYTSDETGAVEVFVRPFPGPGRAWRVSTDGGAGAFWRRDGRELYYLSGGQVMAVGVDATAGTLKLGVPTRLFGMRGSIVAAPDGKRFLVVAGVGDLPTPPLTIIVNSAALRSQQ